MKNKKFILFPLLAFVLSSCLFDSDDDGLSSWLSDQGMPSSYKVETLTVSDLKPTSVELRKDTLPRTAWAGGVFGANAGLSHDIVFDFALDESFLANLKVADSAKSLLFLYLQDSYYKFDYLPSHVLPIKEDVKLNVSWKISEKLNYAEYNALATLSDSAWFDELGSWKTNKKADTTISISITKKDSLLTLNLPNALVNDVRKNTGNRRLQLRLSAPEASHVFRVYGGSSSIYFPRFRMVAMENDTTFSYATYVPTRMASIVSNHEECSDCLVLHGGVSDSLLLEFSAKPIMKALSDFYGDEFPYSKDDGFDVRQAVVMAQMIFLKDDAKGESELDWPIGVKVCSFADSADTVVRRVEKYLLANTDSLDKGYPNMVFFGDDSLKLQVTAGIRDFINRAHDGRSFKMTMNLDRAYLIKGDSAYYKYDYARYDFSTIKSKPATLKLWLVSKRDGQVSKENVREEE